MDILFIILKRRVMAATIAVARPERIGLEFIFIFVFSLVVLSAGTEQRTVYGGTCTLTLSEPSLRTTDSRVSAAAAGELFVIVTTITGCIGADAQFVAIVEARNSNGITEVLSWQPVELDVAENGIELGSAWVPAGSGDYELRVFAISGFDNPRVLSPVATTNVAIAENPDRAVIVIPYDREPALQQLNFEPSVLKIVLGINNTVVWTNISGVSHKVKPDPESPSIFAFETRQIFLYPGQSYAHVFEEPGSYHYVDVDREWMHGMVWVIPREAVDAYLNFNISGLQDSYRLGQEAIEFSLDIYGFETGCGSTEIVIERIDQGAAQHPFVWSSGKAFLDCFNVAAPYNAFNLHFPLHESEPVYRILVDQPGTYRLTASFENEYTSARYTATKDFGVTH
jgi:plastocyanin